MAPWAQKSRTIRLPDGGKQFVNSYTSHQHTTERQTAVIRHTAYKLNFGARSFRVAVPTVWNSLPADIRACTFYASFTRQLKNFYFNNVF